ncbi:20925_t:CDS:2 [Dentiscutata erythropus]|uniref:20925_t:CDS:1 n=1 Tax=Dentiscutata erythropus TaxID=1348616 RepID=A0A9N9BC63_9GLOM|nr:20925_t:CDS:2 [Dentiscutata erythropus]
MLSEKNVKGMYRSIIMDSSTPCPLHTFVIYLKAGFRSMKVLICKYNHDSSTPLPLHTLRDLFKVFTARKKLLFPSSSVSDMEMAMKYNCDSSSPHPLHILRDFIRKRRDSPHDDIENTNKFCISESLDTMISTTTGTDNNIIMLEDLEVTKQVQDALDVKIALLISDLEECKIFLDVIEVLYNIDNNFYDEVILGRTKKQKI